jgi:hypothetical protein
MFLERKLIRVLLLALPFAAFGQTEAPAAALAGPPPKLVVVPFATLSGEVPPRAGLKAAGMLSTEFKSAETVQLLDLKRDLKNDPHAEAIATARKAVAAAVDLRKKRKFRLAEEELTKALGLYKANAAGVTEIAEVADAHALLSAVQYNTGRDEDGAKNLTAALALAPDRELPLAATSALFSKVVLESRRAVKTTPTGSLHLECTPSGAVSIDGVPLGGTPLMVKEVPIGAHYWRIALPSGEVLGGVVEVGGAKVTRVTAAAESKDPEARILAVLSQNKIDADLLAAAKDHAKGTTADLVVFGALSKEGKGLALDSFVFSAAAADVRRLPRALFDTELLSAGMEFYNLAGQMAQKGIKAGEAVKLPTSVVAGTSSGAKVADAKYGVQPGKDVATDENPAEPAKDDGSRKPVDGKRTPLKKK